MHSEKGGGERVEKDKYYNIHFAAWLAWSMGWRWTNNLGNALCSPRVYYVSRRINNFDGISAWNAVLQPPCHILGDGRENNIEWKEKTHWQKQFMSVIFFLMFSINRFHFSYSHNFHPLFANITRALETKNPNKEMGISFLSPQDYSSHTNIHRWPFSEQINHHQFPFIAKQPGRKESGFNKRKIKRQAPIEKLRDNVKEGIIWSDKTGQKWH